jgi:hypothetical protein
MKSELLRRELDGKKRPNEPEKSINSDTSADAFAHALRIAIATKSKLYLVGSLL